jgi:hypothetical protein
MDDFPYVEFVHHGVPCEGPQLTMRDSSSTLSPRVLVTCTEKHPVDPMSRNIQDAAGRDGWASLPRCRGRHPHLQRFEECGKPLHLMVLGASNLWFSVTASALHLPQGLGLVDVVAANWALLGAQPGLDVLQLVIDQIPNLASLRDIPVAEVWDCIESLRATGGPVTPDNEPADADELLGAEWRLLARPTTDKQDDDFRAEVVQVPPGHGNLLDQVVQVSRLREVRALVGFTRNSSPERGDLRPDNGVPLSVGPPTWALSVEQRGEGIFLQLHEDKVAKWENQANDNPRVVALRDAYNRWRANRQLAQSGSFPVARYLLLHTLSHLLVRQISLECGYSSASIRERIYTGAPGDPHAGLLLSTAASDSEGTLGGLVALAQPVHLRRVLDQAFDDAQRCSSDPLCSEHVPIDPSEDLHAAACHACLFASETTCEINNRWLDRAVLVDLTGDGLAFR